MMRTMVRKAIKLLFIVELIIALTYLFSRVLFANIQVAYLSSLFVILGSSYAYRKMIDKKVNSSEFEDKRDLLDEIEDKHGLYNDEINEAPSEELDLKEIVKEEKAKIKTFSFQSIKHGARGSVSLFRVLPYIFLILGFIALKNNNFLDLRFYLPSLLIGIFIGSFISKEFANS